MEAFIVLCLFICPFITGAMAASRRRSVVGWALAGLCFGLIAVLILAVAAPLPDPEDPALGRLGRGAA